MKRVSIVWAVLLFFSSATIAFANTTITRVDLNAKDKDANELVVFFKENISLKPKVTSLLDPLSITIDFPNAKNSSGKSTLIPRLASKEIKEVKVIQSRDKTRLIIYLNRQVTYDENLSAKSWSLRLKPATFSTTQQNAMVKGIDFKRLPDQGGSIYLKVSGGGVLINPRTEGAKIIIDIKNSTPISTIIKNYDVTDFGTLISSFDLYPIASQRLTRLTIDTSNSDFDYSTYQSNEYVIVEVKALTSKQVADRAKARKRYTGERISLNFNNVDVRTALNIIADVSQLDLIISDSVSGQLTLNLKEIPWDEALDVILRTKNLAKRIDGKILRIGTVTEFASQDKLELESNQVAAALAPLRTEFIQVNYAKAGDLASLIKGDGKSGLLSERGSLSVDSRTNTLLARESSDNLAEIRSFISRLDIPVKQVLIESRIVIANDSFSDEIGSRFGISGIDYSSSPSGTSSTIIGGSLDQVSSVFDEFNNDVNSGGELAQQYVTSNGTNYSNPAGGGVFALSLFDSRTGLLNLELSAMQVEERGEVVSNPRIITVEQQEASIEQGVDIPYQESGANGATTTSFKKATLGLKVKPQITPDDKVIMDLEVKNDTPGSAGANGVPSIDTRTVQTQVVVPNGDTVVLGGIFEQTKRKARSKVPLFGDIPILGALFRRDTQNDIKSELLIFITPKIIKTNVR